LDASLTPTTGSPTSKENGTWPRISTLIGTVLVMRSSMRTGTVAGRTPFGATAKSSRLLTRSTCTGTL